MLKGASMRLSASLLLRSLLRTTTLVVSCTHISFGVSDGSNANRRDSDPTNWMKLAQSSSSASGFPNGQFRFEIQTQKSVQMPEHLRPSNCPTDDECEEYSGLPKSDPGNTTTVKNFKKPFIGLSITAPLQ
jgi:hypothetical protein